MVILMSNTGSMLDTYLVAQALGWEWNLGTMLILTIGIPVLFVTIGFVIFAIGVYFKWW